MFPLSFNTQCLRNLPLDRAIEVTAAAGYEGIDLAYRAEHLHPFDVTQKQLDELNDLLCQAADQAGFFGNRGPIPAWR